jgi:hypothetical protein
MTGASGWLSGGRKSHSVFQRRLVLVLLFSAGQQQFSKLKLQLENSFNIALKMEKIIFLYERV